MINGLDLNTIDRLKYINKIIKHYDNKVIPYQLCEICFKPKNLIICGICKNFFHLEVRIT